MTCCVWRAADAGPAKTSSQNGYKILKMCTKNKLADPTRLSENLTSDPHQSVMNQKLFKVHCKAQAWAIMGLELDWGDGAGVDVMG